MRQLARIQIRGDAREFVRSWNTHSNIKIEQRVIALYKDQPEYEQMRQMFSDFAQQYGMSWFERVEVEYSERELLSFELFTLHIIGQAGAGNNDPATVYDVSVACSACHRLEFIQRRDLVLDPMQEQTDPLDIGYFRHDICETDFHEIIISGKVRSLIEKNEIKGIAVRPVNYVASAKEFSRPYYQLIVAESIGPLAAPSPVQRLNPCEVCGHHKEVLMDALPGTGRSEFYFKRSSYGGQWILSTSDCFGRVPDFQCKTIINQQFYRLLGQYEVNGFWVEPVHLID